MCLMLPSLSRLNVNTASIGTPATAYDDIQELVEKLEELNELLRLIMNYPSQFSVDSVRREYLELMLWLEEWKTENGKAWEEYFHPPYPGAESEVPPVPPRDHPPLEEGEDREGDEARARAEEDDYWEEPLVMEGWKPWFERTMVKPFNKVIEQLLPDSVQAVVIIPVAITSLGLQAYDEGLYSEGARTLGEILKDGAKGILAYVIRKTPVRNYISQSRYVAKLIVASMLASATKYQKKDPPDEDNLQIDERLTGDPLLIQTLQIDHYLGNSDLFWVKVWPGWRIIGKSQLLEAHAALMIMYDMPNVT